MLQHSFIHLPGVGPATEWRLWRAGLTHWDAALDMAEAALDGLRLSPRRSESLRAGIVESAERLAGGDAGYFAQRLAGRETWRLFGDFCAQAAYLDIETNGYDLVTAVVLHQAGRTQFFARDENLHELPMHLAGVKLLVTYNGRSFDWPVLRASFANLPEPAAHLDLRYPFARLQFRGGLKGIEKAIGLNRPDELQNIDGWSAVWLWHRHRRGDPRAMPALLRYCAEDVLNLKFLAEWAHNKLASALPVGARLFENPAAAPCDRLPQADPNLMVECRAQLRLAHPPKEGQDFIHAIK